MSRRYNRLNDTASKQVMAMIAAGFKQKEVAKHFGVTPSVVTHIKRKHEILNDPEKVSTIEACIKKGYSFPVIARMTSCQVKHVKLVETRMNRRERSKDSLTPKTSNSIKAPVMSPKQQSFNYGYPSKYTNEPVAPPKKENTVSPRAELKARMIEKTAAGARSLLWKLVHLQGVNKTLLMMQRMSEEMTKE